MPKVASDPFKKLCQPAHVADDGALEFGLAAGRWLAGHGVLQVSIQALVRVQLRTIGWQVEDLDLLRALSQPAPYRLGPMDRQVVPDQKPLARGILDQPAEKADQARGLDGTIEHHPAQ